MNLFLMLPVDMTTCGNNISVHLHHYPVEGTKIFCESLTDWLTLVVYSAANLITTAIVKVKDS